MKLSWSPLLLAGMSLAAPAVAQDWKGGGRLEGRVMDGDGKPLANAVVKLQLPKRGGTQLRTDAKGKWAFLGLASGSWNIDIEAPGFAPKQVSVQVSEIQRTPLIEVKLEKAAPAGPPPEVVRALEKGDEAFKAGRYEDARRAYEELLALRPEFAAHLHLQIAFCYGKEKNPAKELEHLQYVLDANPTDVKLRKLMTLEALEGGMFDKGLELLKGLDDSTLQEPDVLYNIAVAFFRNQKVDEAILYLTKALTIDPTYADGYFLRGNAYLGQNKVEAAKADYRRFLQVAPTDPRAETVKKALDQLK
jgi:tetratricopeptide (TPR) repeat protein